MPSKRDILKTARDRFQRAISAESKNRAEALEDLKFLNNDQWDEASRAHRVADRRPCLTVNKCRTFVHQITNDQRQNRPAISVSPLGEKGNKHTAQVLRGLVREIERESDADIAYDTGFMNCVANGFGYWRVTTDYEDETSFDQVIRVMRIRNPMTVYLDVDRKQPDGSDAKWGFVTELIPRDDFKAAWPKADPIPWDTQGIGDDQKFWSDQANVRVAEYFTVETEIRTLLYLANGHIGFKDELDASLKARLDEKGFVLDERESECRKIIWRKITGREILDESEWPGRWIPIVECIGDEIDIEGKVSRIGIIRDAKDAQRMKNFWSLLCLETPIPTPYGWKRMGDVHAGDKVYSEYGDVCNVVGESPVHLYKDCYKVLFDDGCEVVASGDHLWQVEERGKRKTGGVPLTTKTIHTDELNPKLHFIKTAKPLKMPDAYLPIHPYVLGHWLSDGTSASATITPGDQDIDELRAILKGLGSDVGRIRRYGDRCGAFTVHGISSELRTMDLLNNKHIPQQYLRASHEQRLMLLRGFMDSDGSIGEVNNLCSYSTVTPKLAEGFSELLASLGIRAGRMKRDRGARMMPSGQVSVTQPFWQFSFCPGPDDDVCLLERKRAVLNRPRNHYTKRTKRHNIVSVERVSSVPVKCITVDSPNNLYLCGHSMIPTHNSAMTERVALETKSPWVMAEGQIEGHEEEWRNSNTQSRPVMLYKPTDISGKLVPPPQRQSWMGPPAGVMAAEAQAEQDMMTTTGVRFDATKSERINEESGIAIQQLKSNQQLGAYHYIDNLGRSLKHTGRIIIDLIPHIYDTQRILTIINEDGSDERVQVNPMQATPFDEVPHEDRKIKSFNPNLGKYEVAITIGPNYQTKMQEAAEGMMNFGKAFPNAAAVIGDLVAKNQVWPDSDLISRRIASTLPPEMLLPEQKDVTPQIQAYIVSLQKQLQQTTQQLQQAGQELTNRDKDRAIDQDKIDKDFEAKMTKIVVDANAARDSVMLQELTTIVSHIRAMEQASRGNGKVDGH